MNLTSLVTSGTAAYRLVVLSWASFWTDAIPKDGISMDRTKNLFFFTSSPGNPEVQSNLETIIISN